MCPQAQAARLAAEVDQALVSFVLQELAQRCMRLKAPVQCSLQPSAIRYSTSELTGCPVQAKPEKEALKLLRQLRDDGTLRGFGCGRQVILVHVLLGLHVCQRGNPTCLDRCSVELLDCKSLYSRAAPACCPALPLLMTKNVSAGSKTNIHPRRDAAEQSGADISPVAHRRHAQRRAHHRAGGSCGSCALDS